MNPQSFSGPFCLLSIQSKSFGRDLQILFGLIFLLVLTVILPVPAHADLLTGLEAFENKEYSTALSEWEPEAQKGDGIAQYLLGYLFFTGQGTPKDYKKAAEWFLQAAEQRKPTAMYYIGEMFHGGNDQEAAKWFFRAALGGDKDAQSRLGFIYADHWTFCQKNDGISSLEANPHYQESFYWYLEAARNGSTNAQDLVGEMYLKGLGVPKDVKIGDEWKAKTGGRLGGTLFQKAVDDAWMELAQKGIANAQYQIGSKYLHGNYSLPKDAHQAGKWFFAAARQGHELAILMLSTLRFFNEEWTDKKHFLAWVKKSSRQGIAHAQLVLAIMYSDGQGVPQDYVLAHMWYNLSAAQGTILAKNWRDDLAKRMTPQQVEEAQRLARQWKPKRIQEEAHPLLQQEEIPLDDSPQLRELRLDLIRVRPELCS